ncbi:MAG TPA: biotin carboxylase N-terminal domain-containing protein [Actinomycetota bacterium]|nr:biotin carboxylase N-terminal domain-containing protein [Actinomycetota bacterium]
MFSKVLIANRGEIAVRIARTCHDLGIEVIAVHSDVDSSARHVAVADHAIHLPGVSPVETYLNVGAIVGAARNAGAEAVHPGYGFLSERADVATAVAQAGMVWVGPPPEALEASGDKLQARKLAESAGVAAVPGTLEPVSGSEAALAFGEEHGYPIAIKAAGGGGGRGLKVAASADEVAAALESAAREAKAYFGFGDVYLERYLPRPKHIEVQILASSDGKALWLGARDCSLQRRHQKLVEETPPPKFRDVTPAMGEAAVAVANGCGYVNAGTVEFLVDEDGRFYFLEINARLQVEHTITEEVTGLDLVACQLKIAAAEGMGFVASDLTDDGRFAPRGHAIECRINAEDPSRKFMPKPGRIERYREPAGPGVRVDSGFGEGDEISPAYDSLIAKLIVWGPDREVARKRMLRALGEFEIEGIPTTIPAHQALLQHDEFVDGSYSTRTVEGGALDSLMARTVSRRTDTTTPAATATSRPAAAVTDPKARLWHPAIAPAILGAQVPATTGRARPGDPSANQVTRPVGPEAGAVVAPMHGTLLKLLLAEGDRVEAGDPVAVLEAMKMETQLAAPRAGVVREIHAQPGSTVEAGQAVAVIALDGE